MKTFKHLLKRGCEGVCELPLKLVNTLKPWTPTFNIDSGELPLKLVNTLKHEVPDGFRFDGELPLKLVNTLKPDARATFPGCGVSYHSSLSILSSSRR